MVHVQDLPRRTGPFARMMAGLIGSVSAGPKSLPKVEPLAPVTSHDPSADDEYERLASFGSWSALRDNLRASEAAPARKRA